MKGRLIWFVLVFILLIGCGGKGVADGSEQEEPFETEDETPFAPDDFEVSMVWGVYGCNSYDSASGILTRGQRDNNAEYHLTDDEKEEIFNMAKEIEFDQYPLEYNPDESRVTAPPFTIIIKIMYNGKKNEVRCVSIANPERPVGYGKNSDDKGKKFLGLHFRIVEILSKTDEWKTLPKYEMYYD